VVQAQRGDDQVEGGVRIWQLGDVGDLKRHPVSTSVTIRRCSGPNIRWGGAARGAEVTQGDHVQADGERHGRAGDQSERQHRQRLGREGDVQQVGGPGPDEEADVHRHVHDRTAVPAT
jgi:hypothetical protein